jgi:ribosomal protein L37E
MNSQYTRFCPRCGEQFLVRANFCPHCATPVNQQPNNFFAQDTPSFPKQSNPIPTKKVGILLAIGILFLPYIFSWFTLQKGYSTLTKLVSFGWLCIVALTLFSSPQNIEPRNTATLSSSGTSSTATSTTATSAHKEAALSLSTTPVVASSTPFPKTPAELLSASKILLADGSLAGKEEAYRYLRVIPENAQEYKQAQQLLTERKQAKIEKPSETPKTESNKSSTEVSGYRSSPTASVSKKPSNENPSQVLQNSGATAKCRDGSLSYSAHRRGTCSHHGGVAVWY